MAEEFLEEQGSKLKHERLKVNIDLYRFANAF